MTDPENLGRAESIAICPAIWADRHGDFYVGEVFKAKRIQKFVHKG
jgi:hypothetical protein